MLNVLFLPLQLILLTLLHLIFATSRFASLLSKLFHPTQQSTSQLLNPISHDLKTQRWSKTPKHLAVVFAPGTSLRHVVLPEFWYRLAGRSRTSVKEEEELEKLVKDCRALVGWAEELGVHSLSLYDAKGVLDRNAEAVVLSLAIESGMVVTSKELNRSPGRTSFEMALPHLASVHAVMLEADKTQHEVDSGCGVSESGAFEDGGISSPGSSTLVNSTSTRLNKSKSRLTVNLLSRSSGRPQLARVAQELARDVWEGRSKIQRLAEGLVEETIEATAIPEPDALLVLGGPYLRLHGFPPWEIRLTEMHHHSSPSWLPPPPISYDILRKALDVYGGAEMRLGR